MSKSRRGRVSPALVISIIALVLAAGGTSFASAPVALIAKAVGLNSTQKKQVKSISKSVADSEIKAKAPKLSVQFANSSGNAASAGSAATAATATNATNATHATTAESATTAGSAPLPTTLPSGETTTGAWAMSGAGETLAAVTAISFPFPVGSRPTVHTIALGGSTPSGCSGNAVHPGAAPGNLCIFEGYQSNVKAGSTGEFEGSEQSGKNQVSGFTGATLYARGDTTTLEFVDSGTFAVTAP